MRWPIWHSDGSVGVPLTRGKIAIIDAADWPLVSRETWHAYRRQDGRTWYAMGTIKTLMHRLLIGLEYEGLVDHKDGDGLNNRRSNLRRATFTLNSVNRRTPRGRYLRGTWPWGSKWEARIKVARRQSIIGYFATELEAHMAYVSRLRELYGDFSPYASDYRGPSKNSDQQAAS